MKIIIHGNKNLLKEIRCFKCKTCGCIFEADNTEYVHQFSQRENCDRYEIKCPTCGNFASLDTKEDTNES